MKEEIYHAPTPYAEIVEAWASKKTTTKVMANFFKAYISMTDEQRVNIFQDMNNMIDYRDSLKG